VTIFLPAHSQVLLQLDRIAKLKSPVILEAVSLHPKVRVQGSAPDMLADEIELPNRWLTLTNYNQIQSNTVEFRSYGYTRFSTFKR